MFVDLASSDDDGFVKAESSELGGGKGGATVSSLPGIAYVGQLFLFRVAIPFNFCLYVVPRVTIP